MNNESEKGVEKDVNDALKNVTPPGVPPQGQNGAAATVAGPPPREKVDAETAKRAVSFLAILAAQALCDLDRSNARVNAMGIICNYFEITPQDLLTLSR